MTLPAGCPSEIPGESRLPRCEPRGNADPAKLDIDSTAEDFALADPCRAVLQFYIARNTDLEMVEGEIDFSDFDGRRVGSQSFDVELPALPAADAGWPGFMAPSGLDRGPGGARSRCRPVLSQAAPGVSPPTAATSVRPAVSITGMLATC